jgi:hypothetical protein
MDNNGDVIVITIITYIGLFAIAWLGLRAIIVIAETLVKIFGG